MMILRVASQLLLLTSLLAISSAAPVKESGCDGLIPCLYSNIEKKSFSRHGRTWEDPRSADSDEQSNSYLVKRISEILEKRGGYADSELADKDTETTTDSTLGEDNEEELNHLLQQLKLLKQALDTETENSEHVADSSPASDDGQLSSHNAPMQADIDRLRAALSTNKDDEVPEPPTASFSLDQLSKQLANLDITKELPTVKETTQGSTLPPELKHCQKLEQEFNLKLEKLNRLLYDVIQVNKLAYEDLNHRLDMKTNPR